MAGQTLRRDSSGGAFIYYDDHHGDSDCRQICAGKFTFLVGGDYQVLFYMDRLPQYQLLRKKQ